MSGSSIRRTKDLVSVGTPENVSGGFTPSPSQVYLLGIFQLCSRGAVRVSVADMDFSIEDKTFFPDGEKMNLSASRPLIVTKRTMVVRIKVFFMLWL